MSKKVVFIIVGILLFLCCICFTCIAFTFAGFGIIMKDAEEVSNKVVVKVCEEALDLSQTEYKDLFDTSEITYEEANYALRTIFPKENCDDYKLASFVDMVDSGIAFESKNENGKRTAEFTFTNSEDKEITILFVKKGSDWKISGFRLSENY